MNNTQQQQGQQFAPQAGSQNVPAMPAGSLIPAANDEVALVAQLGYN